MGRAAVIGNQQFRQRVQNQQLRQRGFACQRKTARRTDLGGNSANSFRLVRSTGQTDADIGEPFQESLGEVDIPVSGPFTKREQVACIRIQEKQVRLPWAAAFALNDGPYFLLSQRGRNKGRRYRVCSRHLPREGRESVRGLQQSLHHQLKVLAGMDVRIVKHPMRHQISSVRAFAKEGVKPDPRSCA
jgi:hypothetical protein